MLASRKEKLAAANASSSTNANPLDFTNELDLLTLSSKISDEAIRDALFKGGDKLSLELLS
jgi:hypothetical protein